MGSITLYPLRLEPIYQYRLWGGRRLSELLSAPLPGDGPIGEAWVLSDRGDHQSKIANGPLKGQSLSLLMEQYHEQMMGALASRFSRFPLLLKFLDAQQMLSVQVHPSDAQPELLPPGEMSKTEAWVVIEAEKGSRIYAGLRPGTTAADLRRALTDGAIVDRLNCIVPSPGDAVFIPAGTVHSLGGGVVVFEVQQNSDVTFRLHDWSHVDAKTGQPRPLQVEQAFACIDFNGNAGGQVAPCLETVAPVKRERLFECEAFCLYRVFGSVQFTVGAIAEPRVLVCLDGSGQVEHGSIPHPVSKGDVWLLPAEAGVCRFRPSGEVTLLELAIPR
jgi:mannose-6-phosphate isomerase